jgi:hypothetical protein
MNPFSNCLRGDATRIPHKCSAIIKGRSVVEKTLLFRNPLAFCIRPPVKVQQPNWPGADDGLFNSGRTQDRLLSDVFEGDHPSD